MMSYGRVPASQMPIHTLFCKSLAQDPGVASKQSHCKCATYSHICNCIIALLLASCFASCTCFSFFVCLFRGLLSLATSAVAFGETWRLNHHPVRLFLCNLVPDGLSQAVFSGTLPCPFQTLNLASVLLNKTPLIAFYFQKKT